MSDFNLGQYVFSKIIKFAIDKILIYYEYLKKIYLRYNNKPEFTFIPSSAIIITYSITCPRCSSLPDARPVFNSIGIILDLFSNIVCTVTSTLPLIPNSGTHKFSSIS